MKPGSLVVIKKFTHLLAPWLWKYDIKWNPVDDESTVYTIREVHKEGCTFEEGIMGYNKFNSHEICLRQEYIVEIQPPISSEEIAELVAESCCVAAL